MPSRQPFTALCQALHRPPHSGRADLHVHTTASDGTYTPAQVVDLARRTGLAALAITDHDTLTGVASAQEMAAGSGLTIIPGVEITAEHQDRELRLLWTVCASIASADSGTWSSDYAAAACPLRTTSCAA
jgi:hypothetical protein